MTEGQRLYTKMYRHLVKASGYQMFGFDMRTLRITHPQIANKMQEIIDSGALHDWWNPTRPSVGL